MSAQILYTSVELAKFIMSGEKPPHGRMLTSSATTSPFLPIDG